MGENLTLENTSIPFKSPASILVISYTFNPDITSLALFLPTTFMRVSSNSTFEQFKNVTILSLSKSRNRLTQPRESSS